MPDARPLRRIVPRVCRFKSGWMSSTGHRPPPPPPPPATAAAPPVRVPQSRPRACPLPGMRRRSCLGCSTATRPAGAGVNLGTRRLRRVRTWRQPAPPRCLTQCSSPQQSGSSTVGPRQASSWPSRTRCLAAAGRARRRTYTACRACVACRACWACRTYGMRCRPSGALWQRGAAHPPRAMVAVVAQPARRGSSGRGGGSGARQSLAWARHHRWAALGAGSAVRMRFRRVACRDLRPRPA